MQTDKNITSVLKEHRQFDPPKEFAAQAHIKSLSEYESQWQFAKDHPEEFWGEKANQFLTWFKGFDSVLDWQPPYAKWFTGGKLNAAYNCLDRHLHERGNKPAIIWEGEPGEKKTLTYAQLHSEVVKFACALKKLGFKAGDIATIYMPMIPEHVVAILACARLGITHSVIFAGFSSEAIAGRNNDAKAKLLITADGGWRRGAKIELKNNVDEALKNSPTVQKVIVFKRLDGQIAMQKGRDLWWHELMQEVESSPKIDCPAVELDSEHPLFLLYTSGSTGKPKGILHTTGGYLLGAAFSFKYVFDLKEKDIYWCTADIGWVTGHSYIVYGPLAIGATVVMYEGAPNFPDWGRFWQMIERYKVTIFYTAPTAIRAFIKAGNQWPQKSNLSSLRLLGTVGEPINPEAWMWYREVIGGSRCPIIDTWWQTETGGIMIAPLPGATPTIPGTATKPFFGIVPEIVDQKGKPVKRGQGGFLVISKPWPSMLRNVFGDSERYEQTYWRPVPGKYFTGDGARQDEHGNFWIMGRIDDVLNVAGHRLSTMEIESALVAHAKVSEAAVVGMPHEVKGEGICCFVTLKAGQKADDALKEELTKYVAKQIGAIAKPDSIRFTEGLPKTRSGKIMRRLLRDIAAGRESKGDVTTLEDFSVIEKLRSDGDDA